MLILYFIISFLAFFNSTFFLIYLEVPKDNAIVSGLLVFIWTCLLQSLIKQLKIEIRNKKIIN